MASKKRSKNKKPMQKIKRKVLRVVSPESGSRMTLEEALKTNVIDSEMYQSLKDRSTSNIPQTSKPSSVIFDPATQGHMTIEDAQTAGIQIPEAFLHVQPQVLEATSLMERTASMKSLNNSRTALIEEVQTQSQESVKQSMPIVFAHPRKSLLANLVKKVTLIDPITGEKISLDEGRRRGLLDEEIFSEMKQRERIDTGVPITQEEYNQMKENDGKLTISRSSETLYFPETSQIMEKSQFILDLNPQVEISRAIFIEGSPENQVALGDGKVSAEEAYRRGLIDHSAYCDLKEIDDSVELVTIQTTQTVPVRTPMEETNLTPDRERFKFPSAPIINIEDSEAPLVYNSANNSVVSPGEALKIGLIDTPTYNKLMFEVTTLLEPEPIDSDSIVAREQFKLLVKVVLPGSKDLLSPDDAFERGLINSEVLQIIQNTPDKLLDELAEDSRLWSLLHFSVVDKDNSMQIAMDDALALNMINPELYQVIHERANIAENWEDDDLDEEEEDQESETRMVPKGIILITDPETGEQRGLDEAFDSGLIDETRYLELKTEETMGIDELKVSQIQGDIYISHSETSETFSPEEAFSRGLISLEVFQRLRSDVTKNEGIPVVQRRPLPTKIVITAKSTGKSYTLDEALENKLIDKETYDRVINKAFSQNTTVGADLPSVTIQDPVSSQLCTLAEAYRKRIISHSQYKVLKNKEAHPVDFGPEKVVFIPGRVSVVDPTTNDEYSLEEALGLGYFDMESYIELRNASTGKSDLMTLATTGGLNISQDLLAEIDTKRLSRQFSAISLTQILQPKLVHAQIENFELPMIYNVESKTFYAKNEISKLADVKQLPEIYVYPVNDSDIEISVEDAKNRKLITKEEFSQIELLQISEVNKFGSMLFANLKIEKSATEFISIDEAVESKFITDQQKLEIKSKFNSCICAYRVFALFQQSAKMSVFNPKSEVISEAKVNPSNFGQFPPISVVTKGSADVISLGNAISENIIDREAIEKYLSTLYFDSDYASFLLIYVPDEKMLFPAHQAALREHLTVKGFYEIAQTENRIKTFIKKKERNSETMVSAPEALVNGLVTEETYDRLVQKLPDETSLGSLLVYDPYTKNVHSLEEAYTLGTITFDHVKSVLLNSTTHPRYVSKLSIVDRNQNAMISPELALESKIITSEEFESMFLNFTRGFEKVLSSKIKILNPKTAEIFTIEDAMNLGYTTYEKYCDLSQIAVEVPQGVPSLLVVTDKSELLSPVVGFLEGSITKDIYKNLYHEHVDFLHPLKPSRISVLDPEDGVVRTLEETFSMGLVEPESYSDMLAKLVENSSGCPSLMVRNPEDSQLMTLQEAVEEEVIDPTVIDQIKTEDVFKYKDANTYVIVQNTGEAKLLKDAIAENILSLSEALPMLDAETSADEPLVWESKKRNLLSFDEAVQKGLVPESGFTHPSSRSLLTASQAEAKILVYSKDTDSVVPLKTAKEQNIISANVYEQITKDVQSNPQRLTTVMILDNKGKDCFNIFEAVRRHLLHPEKAKELASKHKNAMQLMKAPELTVYSNEFNREMTLEEAIDQSCIKIENAAVTLEKIETEPESLTKCLIVDEKLGCLTTPQEALAAGTIDIAQLKEIQEAVPSTKAPLKETGILIYVSETQQIMSLFEALTSGAVTNETYEELVAKMKTEPELITKLMILDSHSGYVMTPIAAVDSEILDVELFDEFVELQTELLMPMKSTGISVLHIGTEIVVPIEKSILNGMLSPETYNETLNKFKAGNEFMCKLMMFNPLADQVLTLDDAYKKQIVDAERYNTIASLFPEAFESVRATGLNVFIVPSKRFSTVEEALRHRIIPHTVYQQLLNKLAEEPHRLSKTMLYSTLTEQITSFDEALRNGVLTAEDYKQFYDMHPKETDHLSFSFLILDSDSGKIMSCDDAIRDNFTNDDKLNMVTAQANENPYSVTKVMVVDPKSGDLYTPSEAVSNRCLSPTLFQELRDLHPNAFEGTIPTGITVLLDSEGSEVMMLENAVMAGRLSTGVYETITQSLNEDPSQITKVMVLNPTTGCLMSLRAAFDEDVISNDVYNNFVGSNCECLESIRPCEISVLDNFSGEIIPIEVAVHRGHISSQKYKEVLVELQEFPEAWKKLVLIDDYGELVSPEDALEFGYINEEFYFQLRESFPDGFKPAKHNELKIINLQTEQTMSLTEALKNGDVTPLMYDNLMHALQSSPEKLTKAMTIHPRMPNLMTAQDAVQKGFLTSSKFDELKSKYPGIAKPVFIPTLKVYDVQTDTQYFLKDLIKQDKLSEEAVGAVFETMVRKPEEITKNLLYIDAQNQLISLAEATSRNLIDEEKCAELTKNIPESLEPWSLPSEIRTLDPSCNQLIPLEMVTTRGLLNVEEYAKTTKQLATEPELVGKLVVFNKDKRDAKTLELAIREGEVDQRTLSKLKADKSNVKLNRQPTGLCLYNPDNLTVTPAETSLNAGEISQEVYDQLYETFQKSSAKIPGLLILKSGNILTPSEALSKNLIQPSQVRALQQEYPEAFSPQIASGITILEPSSNKAMPLECALNLGLITPEEYVNVASKVNEDPKSYSTRYVFLDFESKKVEKPHVAIICSTFDPETYMKSIEDSKDKRSEEIEQIENMSMASNSTADLSDIQETVVYDPSTKLFITPTTAASKGLIEDPSTLEGPAQSQTFGVAGVIDQKTKSIVRPSEAVKRGLITSEMCEQLFSSSESLASSVGSSTKPKVEDKPKRKGPSKVTIAKPLVKKPEKGGTAAKAPSTQVNIPKIQQKKSSQQSVGTAGRKPAVSGQKTTKAESPTSSKPVTKTKESVVTTSKKAASRTEPTKVKVAKSSPSTTKTVEKSPINVKSAKLTSATSGELLSPASSLQSISSTDMRETEAEYELCMTMAIEYDQWLKSVESKLAFSLFNKDKIDLEGLSAANNTQKQLHHAITDHKRSLNDAVSDMQILLDKRSQYLSPEQARHIRDSISRLSSGFDSVYDVSSANLNNVKSEIEKEKHRQKENAELDLVLSDCESMLNDTVVWLNAQQRELSLLKPLSGEVGDLKVSKEALERVGAKVAAKQRDMEKRVATVGVLASQRKTTGDSDQKLLVLLESLPKKLSDFKDQIDNRTDSINQYMEEADQLKDDLELFSDWLNKFDDVSAVRSEQLEEIVNRNDMLDKIHNELSDYDKNIKKYNRDVLAEEMNSMKKVHQESLKKPPSPIHTSFETKYQLLSVKYNDLLKLCEEADKEPEKLNNLLAEFDNLAETLGAKLEGSEKTFKSLVLDPPESLDDALDEMEAQIDDVLAMSASLEAVENLRGKFEEMKQKGVINSEKDLEESYELLKTKHAKLLNRLNKTMGETRSSQLAQKTPEEREAFVSEKLAGVTQCVLRCEKMPPNKNAIVECLRQLREAQNVLPQMHQAIASCDFSREFKQEKKEAVESLESKCQKAEADITGLLKRWNSVENEIEEVNSCLAEKSNDLNKVPMTEAHFEKLHKLLQSSSPELQTQADKIEALDSKVKDVLSDPLFIQEETIQPSLKENLNNCQQSYNDLLTLRNDKALKLTKLEELLKQFEKSQKSCEQFLHSKRMFLGCGEVPSIDPHSLTKLNDELEPCMEELSYFEPKVEALMTCSREINDLLTSAEISKTGTEGTEDKKSKTPSRQEIEVRHEAEKFRLEADNTKQEFDHVKDLALKRKAVINDLLKQTNEFFLEMRSVTRWLEDKENNMSHAEPISLMSLETIQSQLTNQKKFYQSLNDGSDDSSHPVCRLKQLPARLSVIMQSLPPESKGASLVSKNVDSLVDRYNHLVERSREKLSLLQLVDQQVASFEEMHEELLGWLQTKETAINHLGLIGVQQDQLTQLKLQLKILEVDFSTKQVRLDQFVQLAQTMQLHLSAPIRSKSTVKQKMTLVTQTWQDLQNRIKDRMVLAESALRESSKLNDSLSDVKKWLNATNEKMKAMPILHLDVKSINTQLEQIQRIQSELEEKKMKLNEANDAYLLLTDMSESRRQKKKLAELIENISVPFYDLAEALELRNEKLNRSLVTMTEFSSSLAETVAWLNQWSQNQPKSVQLSADFETLKSEVLSHEQRFRNFVAKEEVVTQLSRAGDEIVSTDGTLNTDSSMVLQSELAQLKSLWQENMGLVTVQREKIERVTSSASAVDQTVKTLSQWLAEMEVKKAQIELGHLDSYSIETYIQSLKVFNKQLDSHLQEKETLIDDLVPELLRNADKDYELIDSKVDQLKQRWEDLKQSVEDQAVIGEDLLKKLANHNETIMQVYNDLAFVKESAESMRKKETGEVQLKVLTNLQTNCSEMKEKLEELKHAFDDCAIPESCKQDGLVQDVEKLQTDVNKLNEEIDERLKLYVVGSETTKVINKKLEDLGILLNAAQDELNAVSGNVGASILVCESIESKFDEIGGNISHCNSDLSIIMGEIDSAKSKNYPISELVLTQHVTYLSAEFENLESELSEARLRNKNAMKTFESLKSNVGKVEECCGASEKALEAIKHPQSVKEARDSAIALDENKMTNLDTLANTVCSVSSDGVRLLMREDSRRTMTSSMGDRTNSSDQLVAEMVENAIQSANSALFKQMDSRLETAAVFFAQPEEYIPEGVKCLSEAIAQHEELRTDVNLMFAAPKLHTCVADTIQMQEELLNRFQIALDEAEQKVTQFPELGESANFEELKHVLENARENLSANKIMYNENAAQIKEFFDTLNPLRDWLNLKMKEIDSISRHGSIDPETIQRQMQQMEQISLSIEKQVPQIEHIIELGSQLTGDSKDTVFSEVYYACVDMRESLGDLENAIQTTCEGLERTLDDLSEFEAENDELIEWLTAAEQRIQAEGNVLIVPDDIQIQVARNRVIDREIKNHAQQVDGLIELGENLLKNSGESGHKIALQRRLDSVDQLFENVSELSSDRIRKLSAALPLATDFGETHRNLAEWFDTMEAELSSKLSGSWDQLLVKHDERMKQLSQRKSQLDIINDCGPKLVALTSGDESRIVESSIHDNNNRFREIEIGLKERGAQLEKSLNETSEFKAQVNELFAWVEANMKAIEAIQPVSIDKTNVKQCKKQDDVLRKLFESLPEKEILRDELVKRSDDLAKRTKDRSARHELLDLMRSLKSNFSNLASNGESLRQFLAQSDPLVEEIHDVASPLSDWLDEVEPTILSEMTNQNFASLSEEDLKEEQNKCLEFQELIQSYRVSVSKIQKNVSMVQALYKPIEGSLTNKDAAENQSVAELNRYVMSLVERYNSLGANVEDRAQQLYFDIQESLQHREAIEAIAEYLSGAYESLIAPESISSDPKKLKEQIKSMGTLRKEVDGKEVEIEKVRVNAEQLLKTNPNDIIGKDLMQMVKEANDSHAQVKDLISSREVMLESAYETCSKFWRELKRVNRSVKEQIESLDTSVKTDPPGVKKHYITQQQAFLQAIREEMEGLGDEVEWAQNEGAQSVLGSVAEVEKALVFRVVEEMQNNWDTLNAMFNDREQSLAAALANSEQFTRSSQELKRWLGKTEKSLSQMPKNFDSAFKAQHAKTDLRKLKHELGPKQVELDAFITKGSKMKADSTPTYQDENDELSGLRPINDPATHFIDSEIDEVQSRWENVCMSIMERQQEVDEALLRSGNDDSTLHEVQLWLDKAEQEASSMKPVAGDMASIEVEIAKLKMLQNDLHSYQSRLDILVRGSRNSGKEYNVEEMNQMKMRMNKISTAAFKRQNELETAKRQAVRFQNSINKLSEWLQSKEPYVMTSKPLGGFPKTITANLKIVNNLLSEFREKEGSILKPVRQEATQMLSICKGDAECEAAIKQAMKAVEDKWSNAHTKAINRKAALEDVLQRSKQFEEQLNSLIQWLTEANSKASTNKDVSVLVEGVNRQIEQLKPLLEEVEQKRQAVNELEKNSFEHKSNSEKQEMAIIKNLVIDIKHRYDQVAKKVRDQSKRLDDGAKRAKQYHGQWKKLYDYLCEEDAKMKTDDLALTTNVALLKQDLAKHKEVQKGIQQKQHQVETILKAGKTLKEKCRPFPNDTESLNKMMKDLRTKWESATTRAASRQHHLESALVRCGQLKDALGVLKEWLLAQEGSLDPKAPLPIDTDSINHTIQHNKALMRELSTRQKSIDSLVRSATEQGDDTLKEQLAELVAHWKTVNQLAAQRKDRLEQLLAEAKMLDEGFKEMYMWMGEAEQRVRFHGPLPDEVEKLDQMLLEHTEFSSLMNQEQSYYLDGVVKKGEDMIKRSALLIQPNGGALNTIAAASNQKMRREIQAVTDKWSEVSGLMGLKTDQLNGALNAARQSELLLEDMVAWMSRTEDTLAHASQHPIPNDLDAIEGLLTEHEELEDEMTNRQLDMDRLLSGPNFSLNTTTQRSRGHQRGAGTGAASRASSTDTNPLSAIPDGIASKMVDKKGRKTKIPIKAGYKNSATDKARSTRSPSVNSSSPDRSGQASPRSGSHSGIGPSRAIGGGTGTTLRQADSRDSLVSGTSSVGTGSRHGGSRGEWSSNPRVLQAKRKYQRLWLQAMERKRKLNAVKEQILEETALENFSFEEWRRNYMKWMQHKKSRVIDFFRKQDTDCDGKVTKQQFIDGIIKSARGTEEGSTSYQRGFTTNRTEMNAVADIFDSDQDGYIDYQEFMSALRPDRVRAGQGSSALGGPGRKVSRGGSSDEEKIMTELKRQISHCTCCKQFMVIQVGDGKYRFGESQRMRLVRVLRATVMVRVGGGWQALEEFLVKNDPCRDCRSQRRRTKTSVGGLPNGGYSFNSLCSTPSATAICDSCPSDKARACCQTLLSSASYPSSALCPSCKPLDNVDAGNPNSIPATKATAANIPSPKYVIVIQDSAITVIPAECLPTRRLAFQ
ncbi:microtubule-actin cross-linking factor 1-like isoform X8 [Symsagittifera roscoffensis]|uniref:microtubule-actin cross-linking factor 1-like isoform X8 n=1 Tax=Symsagittifera roscoffensis TaxID=84072 RepID=UPI00307C5173